MGNPNTDPVYSKYAAVEWSAPILTAANDLTCLSNLNVEIFNAGDEGGYVESILFKAVGSTTSATMARIFLNNGLGNQQIITAPGTPTGTPATTGGRMATGVTNMFAKIVPIGEGGDVGAASAENDVGISVTGPSGSIMWAWTAPAGQFVTAYRVHVGIGAGLQAEYFWAPYTTITASMSATTTMTVTSIDDAPNTKICAALGIGSVFASGPTAGDYIVKQLTSTEADGSLGRNGTYQMSASRTFSGTAITDPLQYKQLNPAHCMIGSFDGQVTKLNSTLIGEMPLAIQTVSTTAPMTPYEFTLNKAIPPSHGIYIGLSVAVTAGWQATTFGGVNK